MPVGQPVLETVTNTKTHIYDHEGAEGGGYM